MGRGGEGGGRAERRPREERRAGGRAGAVVPRSPGPLQVPPNRRLHRRVAPSRQRQALSRQAARALRPRRSEGDKHMSEDTVRDEVRLFIKENWDEDLLLRDWWARLADAGWAFP